MVLDSVSALLLLVGGLLMVIGAVGVLRFPGFFARMHAASITDTLGAGFILFGLMLQAPSLLVAVKLLLVFFFLMFTAPTPCPAQPCATAIALPRPMWKGGAVIEHLIVVVLLALLAVTAVAVIRLANLFAVVMLFGIYSLLSASVFLVMDAGDVAFTEAAVGAGIATVLMLSTMALCAPWEAPSRRNKPLRLLLVALTGIVLVWGTMDLPGFGDPGAPAHRHVAPRYIEESPEEIGIPNMVSSVLASYRGFDTFGEVTVIFTAGLGVLMLLGGRRRKGNKEARND